MLFLKDIGSKWMECSYIVDLLDPDVNFLIVSVDSIGQLFGSVSLVVEMVFFPVLLHCFWILTAKL